MEKNEEKLYFYKINTIIGSIYIVKSDKGLRSIEILEENWIKLKGEYILIESEEKCKEEIRQIREYFTGKRKEFNLVLYRGN